MYEPFSKRVDKVVRSAHTIAHDYGQEWVGTEHILISILEEGTGLGAQLLANLDITLEKLKTQIDDLLKQSMEETWVFGRLPGTPHFKNVIATAIEVARSLSSKEVCTEHLILAFLREEGCVAYNALTSLGVSLKDAETELQKITAPNPS